MKRQFAFLFALLLAAPLMAKDGLLPQRTALAPPTVTTINGNPLQINIGSDNSYQIFNSAVVGGGGQFFPSSATATADSGWFVRVGTTLYAPNFDEHSGSATGALGATIAFGEDSLSAVSGAGTSASPFTVTVVNSLGATGLVATKTVTYVNGDSFFTESFRLRNNGGSQADVRVFLGSDLYLAASDAGVPYREPVSGSPGGRTCPGVVPEYTILHIPLTLATRTTAANYSSVWGQIGGGALDNGVATSCIDNGAALQWDLSIPPNGSRTVLSATSFGPIPPIAQFNITDVNPSLGVIGTTVSVSISGFGFLPSTTFNFGLGITVSDVVIFNSTTATAMLTISPSTVFGYRDVIATQTAGGISATLVDGFGVTDVPVGNYSILPGGTVHQQAVTCVRQRFPATATNAQGWAPDEGTWYVPEPVNPPFLPHPPTGLARAILDCYVNGLVWNASAGVLHPGWCFEEPTPWYIGEYPHMRYAQIRIYNAVNGVCGAPLPGASVFEGIVTMVKQDFLLPPMVQNGFED